MKTSAAALALMLAGCAQAAENSPTIRPVCGRHGAPAILLEVPASLDSFPRFRLRLDGQVGDYAAKHVLVPADDERGRSAEWCSEHGCRVVRSASPTAATFAALRADSSIGVRVETTTPDGKRFTWDGVAKWRSADVSACG